MHVAEGLRSPRGGFSVSRWLLLYDPEPLGEAVLQTQAAARPQRKGATLETASSVLASTARPGCRPQRGPDLPAPARTRPLGPEHSSVSPAGHAQDLHQRFLESSLPLAAPRARTECKNPLFCPDPKKAKQVGQKTADGGRQAVRPQLAILAAKPHGLKSGFRQATRRSNLTFTDLQGQPGALWPPAGSPGGGGRAARVRGPQRALCLHPRPDHLPAAEREAVSQSVSDKRRGRDPVPRTGWATRGLASLPAAIRAPLSTPLLCAWLWFGHRNTSLGGCTHTHTQKPTQPGRRVPAGRARWPSGRRCERPLPPASQLPSPGACVPAGPEAAEQAAPHKPHQREQVRWAAHCSVDAPPCEAHGSGNRSPGLFGGSGEEAASAGPLAASTHRPQWVPGPGVPTQLRFCSTAMWSPPEPPARTGTDVCGHGLAYTHPGAGGRDQPGGGHAERAARGDTTARGTHPHTCRPQDGP